MEVKVRRTTLDDVPALAALQRRAALIAYASIFPPEAPPPELDLMLLDWQRRLSGGHAPDAQGFAADVNDLLTGVIVACGDPDDPTFGHITRFYVDPPQWGHGVGRLLYERAVSHLKRAGYDRSSLWVLEHNERARSWYQRLGWTGTGQRKTVLASAGVDDLRYTKLL